MGVKARGFARMEQGAPLTNQATHDSIGIGSTDEGKSLLLPFVE